MAEKKLKALKSKSTGSQAAKAVADSAHQIWLAGLGAFAKTQEEGTKLFDSLVKEGEAMDERRREQVDRQVKAATDRVQAIRGRAGDNWDRLEKVFEERVSRALSSLGVPTRGDIEALSEQVATLNAQVAELSEALAAKPAPRKRPTRAKAAEVQEAPEAEE